MSGATKKKNGFAWQNGSCCGKPNFFPDFLRQPQQFSIWGHVCGSNFEHVLDIGGSAWERVVLGAGYQGTQGAGNQVL